MLGKVCRGSISRMDSPCFILAVLLAFHAFAAVAADRKFGKSFGFKWKYLTCMPFSGVREVCLQDFMGMWKVPMSTYSVEFVVEQK